MAATVQQQAVFFEVETGTGSILVEARAGTGKTWTLVEVMKIIRKMGMRLVRMPTVALAAYNNKISRELQQKVTKAGMDNAKVGTFHSFGFKAVRSVYKNVVLDERKKWDRIVLEVGIPLMFQSFAKKAMSLAKQRAVGYLSPFNCPKEWMYLVDHFDLEDLLTEEDDNINENIAWGDDKMSGAYRGFEKASTEALKGTNGNDKLVKEALGWACKALVKSVKIAHEIIDFDDMIYMPLVGKMKIDQYDWVMVDEAQDTNPARRELAKLMLKDGGRAIFVGDPYQAIYGFTGADNDALDVIRQEFNAKTLPLTMTFRCSKAVVAVAKTLVPDYEAFEANADGAYVSVDQAQFDSTGEDGFTFEPGVDAILCRNTKPLIDIAFSLIRRGIPCHVEGKDIGKDLLKLVTRWKSIKTCRALADKLEDYREREVAKLMAKKREMAADAVNDRVDTILAIMAGLGQHATVEHLKAKIDSMFSDTPEGEKPATVTLMTAHRSKGLEFPRVFLYGRNKFMPSKYARQDWQLEQERNLAYVAITRAIETLVEVKVA